MRSGAPVLVFAAAVAAMSLQATAAPRYPSPPSHFQGPCEEDPDGRRFSANACYLDKSRFDPARAGFGRFYRRPTCDLNKQLSDRQRELLARAYVLAPSYVKAKLCHLTRLFVIPSRKLWDSWGFWEAPDRPPGSGTFIAISDNLIGENSIADEENELLDRLLRAKERPHPPLLPGLRAPADSDPGFSTLAALAHELGHILLADANADGTDPRHPRRRVSGPPKSACFEHAFLRQSWIPEIFHHHMQRWIVFGDQEHNRQRSIRFNLAQLQEEARIGNYVAVSRAIGRMYRSQQFVSVFAAVRPEEDFVETYKYKVLTDVMPDLAVWLPADRQELRLADHVKSPSIERKIRCIGDLGLLSQ
jgi:hypothetical protein